MSASVRDGVCVCARCWTQAKGDSGTEGRRGAAGESRGRSRLMAVPPGAAQRAPGPAAPSAPQPRRELPGNGLGEARILPAATRTAG